MLGKPSRRCAVTKPVRKPLAPRVTALLREVWWLGAVGLALYLGMILLTYHAKILAGRALAAIRRP
jgi:hypothetical protein